MAFSLRRNFNGISMRKKRITNRYFIASEGNDEIRKAIVQRGMRCSDFARAIVMNLGTLSSKLNGNITLSREEAEKMYRVLGNPSELTFLQAYATSQSEALYSPHFLTRIDKNAQRREEDESLEARLRKVVISALEQREVKLQPDYDDVLTLYFIEINKSYSQGDRVTKLELLKGLDQLITKYTVCEAQS